MDFWLKMRTCDLGRGFDGYYKYTRLQLQTPKVHKSLILSTRIFEGNLTPDLTLDRQKEPENDVFKLFP